MINHTSISHKDIKYLTQAHNKKFNQKQKKRNTLSKPMIYTYFSPFGNKLPKSSNMHSAMRLSGLVFGRWCRENSKDEGF